MNRPSLLIVGVLLAVATTVGLIFRSVQRVNGHQKLSASTSQPVMPPPLTFVGANICGGCHHEELKRWMGSHHQLAMQPANDSTVLGNFNAVKFSNAGVTSSFFRRRSKFIVRTDGPNGALHDYEIKFTFGVYPLQQYLIAMPRGRLQALGIAWDSRARDHGGQRWFFLYPRQTVSSRDPLHWTGIDQTWNYMCADCHSTNTRKNYNPSTRSYATSYAEIDVACEACHGPGSNHVRWAEKRGDWKQFQVSEGLTIALDERKDVSWTIEPATGKPRRSKPRTSDREIQMCARCHARRGQIHEDYVHGQPVDDDYRVALLDEDLYFPDGQIEGEVYEYGSFIQSKMYHAGVTCSDCHEPHSLELRAEGNGVCLQCHSGSRYDSPRHHFHKLGSSGAQCVECHMPARTYMVIDPRRDHSIRIPRPDLSVKLGTPNACNHCHRDKSAQWASDFIDKWYRPEHKGFQHFAGALYAGRMGAPGAQNALAEFAAERDQPAIAHATALSMLASYAPVATGAAVRAGVADHSPLVRRAAARALSNSDPIATAATLSPLLNDPVRPVRAEAAEVLAGVPADVLGQHADSFDRATADYVAMQELNADRPEAHLNLSLLYEKQRKFARAETELKTALSLAPSFAPAAVNLADLYRELERDGDAEIVLRQGLQHSSQKAPLLHALGLLMARQQRSAQAVDLLGAAARSDPGNARYAYVYAVALNDAGRTKAAIATLEHSIKLHPYDPDSLAALTAILEGTGHAAKALTYKRRLDELLPELPKYLPALPDSGPSH